MCSGASPLVAAFLPAAAFFRVDAAGFATAGLLTRASGLGSAALAALRAVRGALFVAATVDAGGVVSTAGSLCGVVFRAAAAFDPLSGAPAVSAVRGMAGFGAVAGLRVVAFLGFPAAGF
jgi:hypothetical protein